MEDRLELKPSIGGPIALWLLGASMIACLMIPHMPGPLIGFFVGMAALFVFLGFIIVKRKLVMTPAGGVTVSGLFGTKQMSWDNVDHYTFWSQDNVYMAGGAAGGEGALIVLLVMLAVRAFRSHQARKGTYDHSRFTMGALRLIGTDGTMIKIDQRYSKPGRALEVAFHEVHARLRARQSLDFSPLQLGPSELVTNKGAIQLADIDKIEATGPNLVVHKRGKRWSFSRTGMRKIKNSLLLIELLGERGLIVKPSAGMYVPSTVLEKLRAATARQSAMPAARVVSR